MVEFKDFAWEDNDEFRLYRASFMACAYNAAVNYGTGRGVRKRCRQAAAVVAAGGGLPMCHSSAADP